MRFLRADVNLHLLALVLLALIAFVGFSFYHQARMNEIQMEYDKKFEHLQEVEKTLLLKEEKLSEVSKLKQIADEDKKTLEMIYLSLQSENKNLQMEKNELVEDMYARPFAKARCEKTGNVRCG